MGSRWCGALRRGWRRATSKCSLIVRGSERRRVVGRGGPMGEVERWGRERADPGEPPGSPSMDEESEESAGGGWVISGNVGSLDDVPEGTPGIPHAEGEPPDG